MESLPAKMVLRKKPDSTQKLIEARIVPNRVERGVDFQRDRAGSPLVAHAIQPDECPIAIADHDRRASQRLGRDVRSSRHLTSLARAFASLSRPDLPPLIRHG